MRLPVTRRLIVISHAVALALVVGVGAAGAASSTRAASLKIAAPTSMKRGSVLALTASGYSGQYNDVSFSAAKGAGSRCEGPGADAIGIQTVGRQHAFHVKFTNIFGAPGPLTLCVYLYSGGANGIATNSRSILKTLHLKVS
jgi:hypothetical protein